MLYQLETERYYTALIHVCSAWRQNFKMVHPIRLVSQAKIMEHPFNCLCNATAAVCVFLHSNTRSYFPSYFSSFYLHSLHFPAKSAAQGLQWKMAFCSLPDGGASCTQLVCSEWETSNISSGKGKSFCTLAEENITDILNRLQFALVIILNYFRKILLNSYAI